MKILIISDLHVKNNVRHDEYLKYFEYIKQKILEHIPDYILFCGDLFHSKTTLSPDSFTYAYKFLKMLTICPNTFVVVLAGNHDMNEKNLDKLDAITPIIEHLDRDRYYYCKTSSDIFFEDVAFRPYPLSDKNNWRFDRDLISDAEILIGIYHGPLNGVKTDLGFVFSEGRDVKEFESCDYLFCGDIHSLTDYTENGSKISVGNPIQQDFGENTTKGMWLYEIESRTQFQRRFIEIPNYFPYITLKVGEDIPLLSEAEKVRFRIFSDSSYEDTQEYVKQLKDKFSQRIQSFTVSRTPVDTFESSISKILTYEEYVKDNINKDKLLELYNLYIKEVEDVSSFNNWKIKQITWNNLLSYDENNFLDFELLEGKSVGIFGKNYSGKTSVIDIICFALYGSWTKSFVKLINLINDKKKYADVSLLLQINGKEYSIYRHLERVGKNCKSTLMFKNVTDNIELNETDIGNTQKSIETYIGSKAQFLLTSLSAQFNNFSLLDEKNTKRKEYFSSFLGITKYEQMFKLVKEDVKTLKQKLEYDGKSGNYIENSQAIQRLKEEIIQKEKVIQDIDEKLKELKTVDKSRLDSIKQKETKRSNLQYNLQQLLRKQVSLRKTKESYIRDIITDLPKSTNIDVDIETLRNKASKLSDAKENIHTEIRILQAKLDKFTQSKTLLNSVPCGTQFLQCRFILNSKVALETDEEALRQDLSIATKRYTNLNTEATVIENQIGEYLRSIDRNRAYDKAIHKNEMLSKSITSTEEEEKANNIEIDETRKNIETLDVCLSEDRAILNTIENVIHQELTLYKAKIEVESDIKIALYKKEGLEELLEKINTTQLELSYLEEFSETVGKNGIIISILNQYIPAISDFVNNILLNFVDFKISIDIENDKDIEIYIEDSFSSRLVETCSGSQMTIIAYALRMALLYYCQIPSCNLVIMDEPATALDSDHLADFSKLIEMLKLYNKTIVMVTHIMMLKDFVEVSLVVDKSSGYSKIIS